MAKGSNRLSAGHLNKRGPAKLCDGGGLWLVVTASDSRRWVFRYRLNGADREMGLGGVSDVSMAEARKLAAMYRGLKQQGVDPIDHREEEKKKKEEIMTFDDCAAAFIKDNSPAWVDRYTLDWRSTLKEYVSPVIGGLPVDQINTAHVMRIVQPIWLTKTVRANHIRNRIQRVLSWAKASGYRHGENPAAWNDHLEYKLPKKKKIHKKIHFAAMPYRDVGDFMRSLPADDIACCALRLLILTANRTRAVFGARWEEIEGDTWTVPAERMKGREAHQVPLSDQALQLLDSLPVKEGWLFPSVVHGKSIGQMAMWNRLNEYQPEFTVHGFRSAFSDWAAESTAFPPRVVEYALAHRLASETEASYQRSTLFEKRRRLMQAWADFCDKTQVPADVVNIRGAA